MVACPTREFPARSHDSDNVVFLDQHRALEGSGRVEQPGQRIMGTLIDQMFEGLSARVPSLRFLVPKLAGRCESRMDSIVLFRPTADQGRGTRPKDTA